MLKLTHLKSTFWGWNFYHFFEKIHDHNFPNYVIFYEFWWYITFNPFKNITGQGIVENVTCLRLISRRMLKNLWTGSELNKRNWIEARMQKCHELQAVNVECVAFAVWKDGKLVSWCSGVSECFKFEAKSHFLLNVSIRIVNDVVNQFHASQSSFAQILVLIIEMPIIGYYVKLTWDCVS